MLKTTDPYSTIGNVSQPAQSQFLQPSVHQVVNWQDLPLRRSAPCQLQCWKDRYSSPSPWVPGPLVHFPFRINGSICSSRLPVVRAAWKNQIGPWVDAGYRVVAPDMLGYGQTDKPDEPEEYSLKKLSDDLAALLDHIGSPRAVRLINRSSAGIVDACLPIGSHRA